MSPFDRMAEKYRLNPQEMSFDWYVDWHMRHGFVYSTPGFFVMGRMVARSFVEAHGLWKNAESGGLCDCWYVHAMAGDLAQAWSILPWALPWTAFERVHGAKRVLTIVRTVRLKALCEAQAHANLHAITHTD